MGYIYKITNLNNNKIYIGKTERTIAIRWREHKKNIKNLQHLPLYKALKKYGVENFKIEEIETCNNLLLDEREIYWINYYKSNRKGIGYNCTGGGEGGIQTYDDTIDLIIERYNNGERLDLLCKEFHHDYETIRPKLVEKGLIINTNAGPQKLSKVIYALNPNDKTIENRYDSISAAGRALCAEGKNPRAIANHIGKYKNTDTVSHGYLWRTETNELEELFKEHKIRKELTKHD